jgi:hypothetical protein
MSEVSLVPNSKEWHKLRDLCTKSIPNKHSALYYLNDKILGKSPLVPMTYRAHLGMCLFAESMTGIPEIDNARVKLVLVSRGIGKTSLVTKGLPILRVLQDRNYATGIANEVAEMAEGFLGDIKNEFETNLFLRILFPEVVPEDLRSTIWKADRIITKRDKLNPTSPTILATGVGGTKTGVHMNLWVCDDLLSKNAAEALRRGSTGEVESTNEWIKQLQPLLKNPKRDPLVFIGTRWWEGDSYEFIEEYWGHDEPIQEFLWTLKLPAQRTTWDDSGETKHISRPPESQTLKVYRRGELAVFRLPAIREGHAIFPERYNEEELALMEQEDPVFFAGQYLLEPTAGAASHFNRDWLKTFEWDGNSIRFRNEVNRVEHIPIKDLTTFISVDPAFSATKKSSTARTAIPVVGLDGKGIFLLEDFAERLDSEDDIAAKVVDFYMRYKPQKIIVETVIAQVAVANAIRRRFHELNLGEPPLEEIKSHGARAKPMRIYGLEHYFKRGIFYHHPHQADFVREYLSFPRAVLRDILDALAFQKDEWEKIFAMTQYSKAPTKEERAQTEAKAIDRVRKAWGRRRRA